MSRSYRLAGLAGGLAIAVLAHAAQAASNVVIDDTRVFPESMTALADGSVIFGSAAKPIIYRAASGSAKAEPWIHLTGSGTVSSLGVLADAKSNTLWVCQVEQAPGAPLPPRRTILRTFNLKTGADKASYPLPGDANLCNDIAIAADGAAFISDTTNGQIFRLKPGGSALELWLKDPALAGVDGLTFVKGALYVNSLTQSTILRAPMNPDGSASKPVLITLSQPVTRPDGMRAQGERLFVAENGAGKVSELSLHGDQATVTVIKDGFNTPTAVQPVGKVLWVGEAKFPFMRDPKLQNQDPGPFQAYALPMPPRLRTDVRDTE